MQHRMADEISSLSLDGAPSPLIQRKRKRPGGYDDREKRPVRKLRSHLRLSRSITPSPEAEDEVDDKIDDETDDETDKENDCKNDDMDDDEDDDVDDDEDDDEDGSKDDEYDNKDDGDRDAYEKNSNDEQGQGSFSCVGQTFYQFRSLAICQKPANLSSSLEQWLQEKLFELCIRFLTSNIISKKDDVFASLLVHFTALLGIDSSTGAFRDPYSYTSYLAGITWIGRILLLEYALPLEPYQYLGWPDRGAYPDHGQRALMVHQTYVIRDTYYPMAEILSLLSYGQAINRSQKRPGCVRWSRDHQILYFQDRPHGISMDCFRQWVSSVVEEAITVLYHDLLLGHRPQVVLKQMQDCMDRRDTGFSFLDLEENRLCQSSYPLLQACRFLPLGKPLRRKNNWDSTACRRYFQHCTNFLKLLMLSIQLSWGQPARQTELCSIK